MLPDLNKIDILILCGGLGQRLKSVIGESQKVMAAIDDQPFLEVLLKHIARQGAKRAILCTGYKSDTIKEYFQNQRLKLSLEFSSETGPLGTGGAVKNAEKFIESNPFLVLNGDSFCSVDLKKFLEFHASHKARASVVISKIADKNDFGSIAIDTSGRITAFKEKTITASFNYVNAGIYCFRKDIFELMPKEKKFSLEKDFFSKLINNDFYGFATDKDFFDIGTPERYEKAKEFLRKAR